MEANFVTQSNLFSVQKAPIKPLDIKVPELDQFNGKLFYMSIVRMPRADMHWGVEMRYPKVADVMPIVCFKTIKRMFHISDNESRHADCHDRLYKIRPLVDAVGEKERGIIPAEKLSIDEQVVPFKGKIQNRFEPLIVLSEDPDPDLCCLKIGPFKNISSNHSANSNTVHHVGVSSSDGQTQAWISSQNQIRKPEKENKAGE